MQFIKLTILLAFFLGLIVGCSSKKESTKQLIPEKLLFGVVTGGDPGQREAMMKPIGEYLTKKIGIPVEFIFTTDYTTVIEAIKAKKIHMAELPPFAYIIASKVTYITPIVLLGADGKPSYYQSLIIASKKSGIKTMDELKVHSKELNLCFTEPASASGHLVPKAYLVSIGLEPKTSFKEVLFGGGHLGTVFSVKSGKVDIGCTLQLALDRMIVKKSIQENDYTLLWRSDPIVVAPIVVRNELDKDLVKKIRDTYLNMDKDSPETLTNYLKVYNKDKERLSYQVANDSMYNGLRKLAAGIKELD